MTTRINAAWHKANRMPAGATLDQRVAWHLAHRKACACGAIGASHPRLRRSITRARRRSAGFTRRARRPRTRDAPLGRRLE